MKLILIWCGIVLGFVAVILVLGLFVGRSSKSDRIIEDLRDSKANNDEK